MNENTESRKLAAIMFTDMVGYSSLSQRNEALALELLAESQRLLRMQFPLFNGREVKTTGDGFLVEFPSALQATQCAVEIQRAIVGRNSTQPVARHIHVRIGIHVGDVVHREADMYGDGVNIAARIEPLAIGGGICLSDTVYAQVRNKLDVALKKLDAPEMKHIEVPMDVYRVLLPWESGNAVITSRSSSSSRDRSANKSIVRIATILGSLILVGWACWLGVKSEKEPKLGVPQPPPATNTSVIPVPPIVINQKSIAVLPFANMSEEKDNAFFADGIHEDLLTSLGTVHDLHVVSRTSVEQYRGTTKSMRQIAQELGVAYVLEGSVRRAGNKVRVTGQLIRADSDEHVWAKSYDRDLSDIFAIQSELATEIAGSLSAVISPQEKSLIDRRPTDNLAAYDLYLKARAILGGTRTDLTRLQAEEYLEQAVKLDPKFAAAWGMLALAHAQAVFGDEDHSPDRLARAKTAIDTAVRLIPNDPDVIERLGDYYYYGFRDYARAAEQYQRLLLLQPNSADAYAQLGFMLRRQGRWADALVNLRHALELDPRNIKTTIGLAELLQSLRLYDESIVLSLRAAELAGGDILLEAFQFQTLYLAHGSATEMEAWMDNLKPTPAEEGRLLFLRTALARGKGDWAKVVEMDEKYPYMDPFTPHPIQDAAKVFDLVAATNLPAAKSRAEKVVPALKALLVQQPDNATVWDNLALLQAVLGDKEGSLQSARKAVKLVPESTDAMIGPGNSMELAQILAWNGDKDAALAELKRLLRTPYGANIHIARVDIGWLPLRGDPRFEALVKDPANNMPLINDPTTTPLP